jgi:hypothetical protein
MAADARISTALPSHPKTRKLRKRLGVEGCWALVCLFLWVADNRADGSLAGLSDEDIELAADWNGEAGAFALVLAEVGFLDGPADSRIVHDWHDHNPWAADRGKRVEKARKAAQARWGEVDANAPSNAQTCYKHDLAMPPTQPNPTQPGKSKSIAVAVAPAKSGTRIPPDFQVTEEHRIFARSGNLPNPDEHVGAFRDYWTAKAGSGAVKRDWDATFRNWLRNAICFGGNKNGNTNHETKMERVVRKLNDTTPRELAGR